MATETPNTETPIKSDNALACDDIEEGQEVSDDKSSPKVEEKRGNESPLSKAGSLSRSKRPSKSSNHSRSRSSSRSRSGSRSPSRRRRRSRSRSNSQRNKRRRRSDDRKKQRSRKKHSRSKSPKSGRSRRSSKSNNRSRSRSVSPCESRRRFRSHGRSRRSSSSDSCSSASRSRSRSKSRSHSRARSSSGIIIRDHRRGARPFRYYRRGKGKRPGRDRSRSRSRSYSRSRSRSTSRSHRRRRRRKHSRSSSRSSSRSRSRSRGPSRRKRRSGGRGRSRSRSHSRSHSRGRSHSGDSHHSKSSSKLQKEKSTKANQDAPNNNTTNTDASTLKDVSSHKESPNHGASESDINSNRSLRPEDIKNQSKAATQNFIASMLSENKSNKSTCAPVTGTDENESPSDGTIDTHSQSSKLTHGFVSTFKEEEAAAAVNSPEGKEKPVDTEMEKMKQELMEKARKKREQLPKESIVTSNVKMLKDAKVIIGKIKKPSKKSNPGRTVTDMNTDYSWYQQYYSSYYSLDPYTAAYYAQYAMVTSGDYSNVSLSGWLESYGLTYDEQNSSNMPLLPPSADALATDQSISDTDKETLTQADVTAAEPSTLATGSQSAGEIGEKITVVTPSVPPTAHDIHFMNCDDKSCDEMDVESDQECPTPPAPPPPPPPPSMTSLIVEEPFSLPNGLEVPQGTKAVIVHPYPQSHALSSQFTAEKIQSALESLETISASN